MQWQPRLAHSTALRPNNSFKPNLLRYTKAMAGKACHGLGSTTQVGLTQALGLRSTIVTSPPKAKRIAAWTAALTVVSALGLLAWLTPRASSLPPDGFVCQPMPWKLEKVGPPIVVGPDGALPEINELGWAELRQELQPGDRLYAVETEVTGGHIAMRGSCYLGSTNAWTR